MSKVVVDDIERTDEYTNFIEQLKAFHSTKGTTLLSEPVLGGKKVDLYKLYNEVINAGGFDQVTKKRSWKQIGEIFDFPSTCTNSAYILKGLYIRNLLGWEEEQIWRKEWVPPEELKGPEAHKASTLAGKSFRKNNNNKTKHPYIPSGNETFILPTPIPFNLIKTNERHQCEVSERHHQTQPIEHVHSTEQRDNIDCITGMKFDERSKISLLSSLESQNRLDIDRALNTIVTISYESPQKLLMSENRTLLNALIRITEHCLQETMFTVVDQSNAQKTILKVLHIIRNFSFIESNIQVFASCGEFKQMLIKCLVTKNSSHYSHCIDILENMAPFVELGPFDSVIGCLNNLLLSVTERSVILGSIRILTKLANKSTSNLHYLLPTSGQTSNRITQFLIANDEELIGTSLEYLYQYTTQSISFGQHLLSLHDGANISILVSLLMAPCKYFRTTVIHDHRSDPPFLRHKHGSLPCVPNLSLYQQLDEPYRCLGWLKDKFELTASNSELSLDDMYLLYQMRFGHEKALRIQDFYTVLKIAFPIANGIEKQGAVLEGTTIRGIQVKMCILQDEVELMCHWVNCSQSFRDELTLRNHILHEHVEQPNEANCLWMDCDTHVEFSDRNELSTHIQKSHLPLYIDNSEIEGVALVAVQLLKELSKNPNSHSFFIPHEQELVLLSKRRPKLAPYIESMFANFTIACSSNASSASSSTSSLTL